MLPHRHHLDPVVWQRRELNRRAGFLVNYTMDVRESWLEAGSKATSSFSNQGRAARVAERVTAVTLPTVTLIRDLERSVHRSFASPQRALRLYRGVSQIAHSC